MKLGGFFLSTIGKKVLVAVTGLFFVFFLIMHLMGNLEIFSGPDAINQYGVLLRTFPKVLWGMRIALIVAVITHIWLTISLTRKNQAARPHKYLNKQSRKASLGSRTMMISGLTLLAFVCYHLAHYTFGIVDPDYMRLVDDQGRHHVYNMMVAGFSEPLVVLFYILAQCLLALHLSHGVASAARTLGLSNHTIYGHVLIGGRVFAITIAALYISIPLAVLFGLLPPDL